jgi:hypothetical protein
MGFFSDLFGGETESHRDGSATERFSDGTSVTRDSDGHVREQTSHETSFFFGTGDKMTVTRDGDDKIVNAQWGWGDKKK